MEEVYFQMPLLRKKDSYGSSEYARELRRLLPLANDWAVSKADPSQALHWFMEATKGGFAKAATMMAIMAARGHGMDPDINLSLQTLKLAADLGDPQAPLIGLAIASGEIPR